MIYVYVQTGYSKQIEGNVMEEGTFCNRNMEFRIKFLHLQPLIISTEEISRFPNGRFLQIFYIFASKSIQSNSGQ